MYASIAMNVHLQDIRRTGRTNLQITLIHFSNQTLLNDYKAAGGVCKDYCDCSCTEEEIVGGVCLVGVIGVDESGRIVYDWNAEGPVYGSNGEFELDPDNTLCVTPFLDGRRPVFSTCKNNCPGGELFTNISNMTF